MTVIIQGDDQASLDLLAHFLGLATHDNINAAPAMGARREDACQGESLGPSITGTCHARFADWPLGTQLVLPFGDDARFGGLVCSA